MLYSDDGQTVAAPRILSWTGWQQQGSRVATRLLSGDYALETVGNETYHAEVTALFSPSEAEVALKDAFVRDCYRDGLFQLETREGRWHVEVLDEIKPQRWKPESHGRTREWYRVTVKVLRRARISQ